MTVSTYGEHAEHAARALNALICDDVIPVESDAVDQLLHCREAVVDALRQRLYDIGRDDCYPPLDHLPARTPRPTLAGIDDQLATLVDNIAFALPSLPLVERHSPVDVLGTASMDPTVNAWRQVAIESLAASHALSSAEAKPWLSDPGAGWWVMRDVAVTLEAVLVLDSRLDEVGLLAEHHRPEFALALEEKRLILSQAARVATWHATSDVPDHATPHRRRAVTNVLQPVSLVSGPEDLAAAQERLAAFLRPLWASDSAFIGEPEISAESARQVTASQLFLCRTFAHAARLTPETHTFVAFFTERAEVLESLQPQIRHLVDLNPHEPNMRRFWQQSELSTAVMRMEDQGVQIRLQPTQMVELAKATHAATHNLGKALRLELLRGTGNLRDAHPRHEEGPVRVGRRSKIETTLTDLVRLPAPKEPVARFSNPLQRAALKQALDLTPSTSQTPTPFPAARGVTYNAPAF